MISEKVEVVLPPVIQKMQMHQNLIKLKAMEELLVGIVEVSQEKLDWIEVPFGMI